MWIIFAEEPTLPTQIPTTMVGVVAFMLVSVVGLLIWIVKWLFGHLDRVRELTTAIDSLTKEVSELRHEHKK